MVKGNNYGKMDLYMKDTGKIIRLMETEGLFIQMVMFTKESGKKIRQKDKGYIYMLMGLNI